MKSKYSTSTAIRRIASVTVGTTLAMGLAACGPVASPSTTNGDTERSAGGDKYPRIVITVDKGEIDFARYPENFHSGSDKKKAGSLIQEAKKILKTHRADGYEVYSLPDRSQGIKTVNGNNWYKRDGDNQYEVTVYGKDVEKRDGKIHLEAVSGYLNGKGWNQLTTGGSSYRNELVVEPIVNNGKVTEYKVRTTNHAGVGRGEFRFYDYSANATVSTRNSDWQTVLDTSRFSEDGQAFTSITSSDSNPAISKKYNWYWLFNPVLQARTETRDDGSQALIFREKWANTSIRDINLAGVV